MIIRIGIFLFCLLAVIFALSACVGPGVREPEIYPVPQIEAVWIRNGEPIEFENASWYPVDDVENFLDNEMLLQGVYHSVQFFVAKEDIMPHSRIYTKFGKHKYRVFEKPKKND